MYTKPVVEHDEAYHLFEDHFQIHSVTFEEN